MEYEGYLPSGRLRYQFRLERYGGLFDSDRPCDSPVVPRPKVARLIDDFSNKRGTLSRSRGEILTHAVDPVLWTTHPNALLRSAPGGAGITSATVDGVIFFWIIGPSVRASNSTWPS